MGSKEGYTPFKRILKAVPRTLFCSALLPIFSRSSMD